MRRARALTCWGVPTPRDLVPTITGAAGTFAGSVLRERHPAILEQVRFSFDPCAERRALQGLQRRCPNSRALVAYATVRAMAE